MVCSGVYSAQLPRWLAFPARRSQHEPNLPGRVAGFCRLSGSDRPGLAVPPLWLCFSLTIDAAGMWRAASQLVIGPQWPVTDARLSPAITRIVSGRGDSPRFKGIHRGPRKECSGVRGASESIFDLPEPNKVKRSTTMYTKCASQ